MPQRDLMPSLGVILSEFPDEPRCSKKTRMLGLTDGESRVIADSFSHNTSMWQKDRRTDERHMAIESIERWCWSKSWRVASFVYHAWWKQKLNENKNAYACVSVAETRIHLLTELKQWSMSKSGRLKRTVSCVADMLISSKLTDIVRA